MKYLSVCQKEVWGVACMVNAKQFEGAELKSHLLPMIMHVVVIPSKR